MNHVVAGTDVEVDSVGIRYRVVQEQAVDVMTDVVCDFGPISIASVGVYAAVVIGAQHNVVDLVVQNSPTHQRRMSDSSFAGVVDGVVSKDPAGCADDNRGLRAVSHVMDRVVENTRLIGRFRGKSYG